MLRRYIIGGYRSGREQGAQSGKVLRSANSRRFHEYLDTEFCIHSANFTRDGLCLLGTRKIVLGEEYALPWPKALLCDELLGGQKKRADDAQSLR